MCDECDDQEAQDREAILQFRTELWTLVFGELMGRLHPSDVLSSLGLLIGCIVAGGDPEVFDQFTDRKGRTGKDAALQSLFRYTWNRYREMKEVADGIRAQLRTGADVDPGRTGPERQTHRADGFGPGDSGQGRGDRAAQGGAQDRAGAARGDGGGTAREDSRRTYPDAAPAVVRSRTVH